MDYYFLASALPELQIGYPPDIHFKALDALMKINLTKEDYQKAAVLRRYYDIQNIRAFWLGEEIDRRGIFNEVDLEESLVTRLGLPEYVYAFLEKYDNKESRLKHFPELVAAYFKEEGASAEGFLKEYLAFEREMRIVLIGFRAKKMGKDLAFELQYEDPYDEIVAQVLAQKDSKNYEPPTRYADLKALFEEHYEEPLKLHQALCEYRFYKVEGMYEMDLFSIGRILAYLAQLMIVERWLELDKKKGLEVIDTIVKEAS
ncbi:uncharacterized protein CT_309 [Waddlia chondrophila 2032/99]|uniref:V-type ATP synthase subunit C n=2 Tax=Waddlia chondrophila TaxID=71667 RepID=D6YV11_WADCW|nr:DUF2764 family protein [Waddlia chondrophila]ADI37972.1 conserved hypothetical protein [Waddlia chondrophila WSU 86-1044]CCB91887.1 uncharacterized protein CT_309 [Waddlia chondrophila 2032/99]